MDVRVDEQAMQGLVAKAIFDGLTPDKREDLIKGAVLALLSKPSGGTNYYGEKTAPIQSAFNRAVEQVALDHARETLSKDEAFQAQLKKLFAEVAAKLFEEGETRSALVSSIAELITRALTKERY